MIVLWLWGGASHMETFDLKPEAPLEYRGDFRPVRTNVPGIEISEHLPLLAGLADKLAIVRSLSHESPGHVSSTHTLLSGYAGEAIETPPFQPKHPDFWAVVSRLLGERAWDAPSTSSPRESNGPAYLAAAGADDRRRDPNAGLSGRQPVPNSVTRDRCSEWSCRSSIICAQITTRTDVVDGRSIRPQSLLTGTAARRLRIWARGSEDPRSLWPPYVDNNVSARRLVEAGRGSSRSIFRAFPAEGVR
jgi:hypothetical protein